MVVFYHVSGFKEQDSSSGSGEKRYKEGLDQLISSRQSVSDKKPILKENPKQEGYLKSGIDPFRVEISLETRLMTFRFPRG